MAIQINHVLIDEKLITYLRERQLLAQYKKAKDYILA